MNKYLNLSLIKFLLKNGILSISISLLIVYTFFYKRGETIISIEFILLFLLVLVIITLFFIIIYRQGKSLNSQKEQLATILDKSTQNILILDEKRIIVNLNHTAKQLLKVKKGEKVNFCDICSTYPGIEKICDISTCFLHTNNGANPVEIHLKTAENEILPVIVTTSTYPTPEGKEGIILSFHTVSEKRKEEHNEIAKLLTHSIFQAQEKERKLISRELHDGIGQSLYSILIQTDIIQSHVETGNMVGFYDAIEKLQHDIRKTIEDIRHLSSELRPSSLDDLGLLETLKTYIHDFGNRFGIQINFSHKGSKERLPSTIETALYRITQEALTNAAKYACTKRIDLEIDQREKMVYLHIKDFGKGFDLSSKISRGVGLYSMEERASILGGKFQIESAPQKGTVIKVNIPIA